MIKRTAYYTIMGASLITFSGCASMVDKLENVGQAPAMSTVANPHTKPQYQPLSWPMPQPEPPAKEYANSLWRPGARSFFRDQRASRTGDILRVKVEISDKAEVDNETKRDRDGTEEIGVPSLFGSLRGKIIPGGREEDLIGLTATSQTNGKGEIKREEKINTQVAAVVTQVLPNGNLVIDGSQEIRVNFEVRQLTVRGIVRPEDIGSDNTIDSSQIAEARIEYGGRGQLTDIQQPRWGQQVIEAVSPF